jgi:hypothetical protein
MENTAKVLFSGADNEPVWFVALDAQKWIGPMSATEVVTKISKGEITWAHFGWRKDWRKDQNGWVRLCDIAAFKGAVPLAPQAPALPSDSGQVAPPPVPRSAQWFLFYSDSQFGPFSEDEVHRFLRIGKIHGQVHAWTEGMKGWEKLKGISQFSESVEESVAARLEKTPPKKPAERRQAPRFPLIARSMMTADGKIYSGMCRDVSIGGMQLLTAEVPGPVGTRIKLNISPPPGADDTIQPFVAEGVIVRELEDGKGFSFRFEKLPAEGKKAIETYVAQQA